MLTEILTHPLLPIVTGILGFFMGHRFALWRDRRNEFNAASEILFVDLEKQRVSPSVHSKEPNEMSFAVFRRHLHGRQRCAFDQAVEAYKKANSDYTPIDEFAFYQHRDPDKVRACAEALIRFTRRK